MASNTKISLLVVALGVIIAGVSFVSCKNDNVPYDTKYIAPKIRKQSQWQSQLQ